MSDKIHLSNLQRAVAIVLLNVVTWMIAIFANKILPDPGWTGVFSSSATVMSAALGAGFLPARPRLTSFLIAISGIASTASILTIYTHMTGFRLGMMVGGVGGATDAIATFTALYLAVLSFVYAVDLLSGFFRSGS